MSHTEIPHNALRHDFCDGVKPEMGSILDQMHELHVLNSSEQLTWEFTFDCGYKGRIIFQLDAAGDCGS